MNPPDSRFAPGTHNSEQFCAGAVSRRRFEIVLPSCDGLPGPRSIEYSAMAQEYHFGEAIQLMRMNGTFLNLAPDRVYDFASAGITLGKRSIATNYLTVILIIAGQFADRKIKKIYAVSK